MRVTMKIYFDDGSEEEQEIINKEVFEDDSSFKQEGIQSNLKGLDLQSFVLVDDLLDWFYEPRNMFNYPIYSQYMQ